MCNSLARSGAFASTKIGTFLLQVQTASLEPSQLTEAEELIQMWRRCSTSKYWRLLLKNQEWLRKISKNWWPLNRWVSIFLCRICTRKETRLNKSVQKRNGSWSLYVAERQMGQNWRCHHWRRRQRRTCQAWTSILSRRPVFWSRKLRLSFRCGRLIRNS